MDEQDDTLPTEGVVWSVPETETDDTEWLSDVDKALWVELDGERGYICENAHTHPGHFHVCFPYPGHWTTATVSELTVMSVEARYWLMGFLAGSEPDLYEYLGLVRTVEIKGSENWSSKDWEREEAQAEVRWWNFCKQFRRDGWHPSLHLRPDRALVITDAERAEINLDPWRPWTYVGERVLVPAGPNSAEWVEADPQPEMAWGVLAGSVCAERRHHNLMYLESGWDVCRDCGEVEVVWDVDNLDAGVYRKVDNR